MISALFFQLEDITVNSKISDPRINTVACVVEGHEEDKDQPIRYPTEESGPKVVIWDYCWLVLTASLLTSIVIWVYLYNWLNESMKTEDIEEEGQVETNMLKIFAGTVFKMTIVTFVINSLIFSLSFIIYISKYNIYVIPYVITYIAVVFSLFLVLGFLRCFLDFKPSETNDPPARCCKCCKCYKLGFWLLFPCLFMSIHHFLWVLCGIISEPYWATPIFLIECLFGFSIMYALYLYERDVVVNKAITEGKYLVKIHLFFSVFAFFLILLIVVFVGHGHIVNVTTAGVIEVIITLTLMWLIKNSGLHLKSFTGNEGDGGNTAPTGDDIPFTRQGNQQ